MRAFAHNLKTNNSSSLCRFAALLISHVTANEEPPMQPIVIKLPDDLGDEGIRSHFLGNIDEYHNALDLDVGQTSDNRVQIDEIDIDKVDLTSDSISIDFTVHYSAYYGCDDANFADEDQRNLYGSRTGNTFTFDRFEMPEQRYPDDEL
ncbi:MULTISPECIES: hypothetical protein [Xanthomonas]|uniref:hypothetical protein n=1 Tax=Xanthomonas TaxID=338 RepID=UPI00101AE658|nr:MULTISPECIES: hypothetical protein [Xanthomonas]MEB1262535.1 hypothetical protein [Xanthomonas campestris pv. campestris]MEB1324884.1 hypothetical protein [Xanthomonas campestris pv. campestris]MEB1358328.1 hypothetical protein [Xanthomonas campestris pv. campestris]MEB1424398.1 hypothetical protein [Xanthomonas campestris pv. campestris]MEB1449298.1 hypothetical protein [Xanthomonas campestris pv. campestris]